MTYEEIKNNILDNININIDKREGSFVNNMISPTSVELAKAYLNMDDILSLGFIETNFDTFLDRRVNEFGVYRKEGKKAIGEITVVGQLGAIIEDGTIVKVGEVHFIALNRLDLSVSNILYVEAIEVGYKGNILTNTVLELAEKDDRITSLVAKADFIGGLDVESDEELRKRFVKVVNNPSTSGNKAHYEEWALEVQGVSNAKVYPLWNGNGTVKVMISNLGEPVSSEIVENAKLHIENSMPIGCQLTVTTPSLLSVIVKASVKINEGYDIDDILESFKASLNEYLVSIDNELVYSKVYSCMAKLEGVEDIVSLTINDSTNNIAIAEDKIVNISDVQLSEVI